jgi:lysophospholipase L1-like esterase
MNILCYGDSNTWGYVPNINGYSKDAVMQKYDESDCWWYSLMQGNNVFVNGLCGRCIAHENKWLKNRNSFKTISSDLQFYHDLDLIIVQLGTNDCKCEYNDSAEDITNNLEALLDIIKKEINVDIIVISPAIITEDNKITQKYYIGAQKKSYELDSLFKKLCVKKGYLFISGKDLETGEDGEHFTKLSHKRLGTRVLSKINELTNTREM